MCSMARRSRYLVADARFVRLALRRAPVAAARSHHRGKRASCMHCGLWDPRLQRRARARAGANRRGAHLLRSVCRSGESLTAHLAVAATTDQPMQRAVRRTRFRSDNAGGKRAVLLRATQRMPRRDLAERLQRSQHTEDARGRPAQASAASYGLACNLCGTGCMDVWRSVR